MLRGVAGGNRDAQTRSIAWDGGVADGGDVNAALGELLRSGEGAFTFTEDNGDDGALDFASFGEVLRHFVGEVREVFPESLAAALAFIAEHPLDGGSSGGGDSGRR